jgi:hypothetical protein
VTGPDAESTPSAAIQHVAPLQQSGPEDDQQSGNPWIYPAPSVRIAGELLARRRQAIAAIELELHRRAHGDWPDPSALPAGCPADPWDGKPMRYRRTSDGCVIYSIGSDGADNNGTDPDGHERDIVFQLYDLAARSTPVPPTPP